jgi:hypothetical protein
MEPYQKATHINATIQQRGRDGHTYKKRKTRKFTSFIMIFLPELVFKPTRGGISSFASAFSCQHVVLSYRSVCHSGHGPADGQR